MASWAKRQQNRKPKRDRRSRFIIENVQKNYQTILFYRAKTGIPGAACRQHGIHPRA
jgi:hypothetical protein